MKISQERLEHESINTGFRPEILEKVIHLMSLLNDFMQIPLLANNIALKGGTALNLFCYDCPRLSVDIDINYIGSADRNVMLSDREKIMKVIETTCLRKDYIFQHKPNTHAGGKWILRYLSSLQGSPRLEIDLNFLTRVPLWPVQLQSSIELGSYKVPAFPILDKHEVIGGKLKALFSRHSSRDLFDTYVVLQDEELDFSKLRLVFVVYGAMSRIDWRTIHVNDIQYQWQEFRNMLIPMLRYNDHSNSKNPKVWATSILERVKENLLQLLPLRKNEISFLDAILDKGEIEPYYLSDDSDLCLRIKKQPGLLWKAKHVKQYQEGVKA